MTPDDGRAPASSADDGRGRGRHAPGSDPAPADAPFALCLTHDVDRPYKTFQAPYFALRGETLYHLRSLLPGRSPYWQLDDVMDLERDLGVRSAFYFLQEQRLFRDRPVADWFDVDAVVRYAGRYSVTDPPIAAGIRDLAAGGWEVGLHGSYDSARDRSRLAAEKDILERVLGQRVVGCRQHYLNLSRPNTWEHQSAIGLSYDASLGSSTDYGFADGYDVMRPLDDAFAVFPLTVMERALPDVADGTGAAKRALDDLLIEARDEGAVMTVLWHPRYFNEREFPGLRSTYRWLIERAQSMGAWIGPPGEWYRRVVAPPATR